MVKQYVWIAIAVGTFLGGIGIGYAAFQPAPIMHNTMMSQQMMDQWMQQVSQDPQLMQAWMTDMMNDPQLRQHMMSSWNMHMNDNPQTMTNWMITMMNDPQLRQQMYDSMMQHNQFMQGMMSNQQFQNQWMGSMMDSEMMNQGMMGHGMMMEQPITQQSEVLSTISTIKGMLDQASASYSSGDKNTAMSLATQAYLENYEYIEAAVAQKDLELMQKVETAMRIELRSMIQEGSPAPDVASKVDSIKSDLAKIESLFS